MGGGSQRFNIRNGIPTLPFRSKIEELKCSTVKTLIPQLSKANMLLSGKQYLRSGLLKTGYVLAEVKDFQGLAPKSHNANVPVFALSDKELDINGQVLENMKNNRDHFRAIYDRIASVILQLFPDENADK